MDLTPEFYRELIENLSEGIYFCDSERKILFWNKGAELLTGYTAEQVVGSHCYDDLLKHVDEAGKNLCVEGCPLVETMRTGLPEEKLVFLRHREGHRVRSHREIGRMLKLEPRPGAGHDNEGSTAASEVPSACRS